MRVLLRFLNSLSMSPQEMIVFQRKNCQHSVTVLSFLKNVWSRRNKYRINKLENISEDVKDLNTTDCDPQTISCFWTVKNLQSNFSEFITNWNNILSDVSQKSMYLWNPFILLWVIFTKIGNSNHENFVVFSMEESFDIFFTEITSSMSFDFDYTFNLLKRMLLVLQPYFEHLWIMWYKLS